VDEFKLNDGASDMWAFLTIVVLAAFAVDVYKTSLKRGQMKSNDVELVRALTERVAGLEQRMTNIETIVLDLEKRSKFDQNLSRRDV
jgi:hypothetical protein